MMLSTVNEIEETCCMAESVLVNVCLSFRGGWKPLDFMRGVLLRGTDY